MSRSRAELPKLAKKYIWNVKHGLLGYAHFVAPEDVVQYLSVRLTAVSTLLDLGCGRGSLLQALRKGGWAGSYCGVDISTRPIKDAQKMLDQRSSWVVSDFESFRSSFHWDVIAMVESIYYVRLVELPTFLTQAVGMLNPEGILLFRLHDLNKHREYLETASALFPGTERVSQNLFLIPASLRPTNSVTH